MTHTSMIPVCGELSAFAATSAEACGAIASLAVRPDGPRTDAFGSLVALYQENEQLLSQLRSLDQQRASARSYLLSPGCNPALARARWDQLTGRRRALLTRLRSNRIAAFARFGGPDRDAA